MIWYGQIVVLYREIYEKGSENVVIAVCVHVF